MTESELTAVKSQVTDSKGQLLISLLSLQLNLGTKDKRPAPKVSFLWRLDCKLYCIMRCVALAELQILDEIGAFGHVFKALWRGTINNSSSEGNTGSRKQENLGERDLCI